MKIVKSLLKGGLYGAILGVVIMIGIYILGFDAVHSASFNILFLPVYIVVALGFWGTTLSFLLITPIIIYFLFGVLIFGTYFAWQGQNYPNTIFLKRLPLILLILIVIYNSFILYDGSIKSKIQSKKSLILFNIEQSCRSKFPDINSVCRNGEYYIRLEDGRSLCNKLQDEVAMNVSKCMAETIKNNK